MNTTSKSILSATGVVASVAAVIMGYRARQQADIGAVQVADNGVTIDRMVASRSNDINVPAGDYFYELSQKLKDQYVEPVTDDNKLVTGAIRGMILSLQDPQSQYLDRTQFASYLNARDGKFEGIGADFALVTGPNAAQLEAAHEQEAPATTAEDAVVSVQDIPRLQVVSVVPGGPADKAGVSVGDLVYSVDGHWVAQSEPIRKFRKALRDFNSKKISAAAINQLRTEIRAKADKAIMPVKAKDMLFLGKSGAVTVVWDRKGVQRSTKITKLHSTMPGFQVSGNEIRLPFVPASANSLKHAIAGKSEVTIDLRNNTMGDLGSMKQCLEVIAPSGEYGHFTTFRHDKPTPLVVRKGNSNPPRITLVTDKSTRGAAEIFALALSSRGVAHLTGSETGGDRDVRSIFRLTDGSGYTLVTSVYKPTLGKAKRTIGGTR